jgi:hypothetical protein
VCRSAFEDHYPGGQWCVAENKAIHTNTIGIVTGEAVQVGFVKLAFHTLSCVFSCLLVCLLCVWLTRTHSRKTKAQLILDVVDQELKERNALDVRGQEQHCYRRCTKVQRR